MLYQPIDTVLLVAGIAAVGLSAVAFLIAGDQRRVSFLIAFGCGVGAFVVVLPLVDMFAGSEGRASFHKALAIAIPVAIGLAVFASRYTTPRLATALAVIGAIGGVAALPLAAVVLISVGCSDGACN